LLLFFSHNSFCHFGILLISYFLFRFDWLFLAVHVTELTKRVVNLDFCILRCRSMKKIKYLFNSILSDLLLWFLHWQSWLILLIVFNRHGCNYLRLRLIFLLNRILVFVISEYLVEVFIFIIIFIWLFFLKNSFLHLSLFSFFLLPKFLLN